MRRDLRLQFEVAPGGWARVSWDARNPPPARRTALFRFEHPGGKGEWRIVEMRLDSPSAEVLKDVPLSRIEESANALSPVTIGLAVGQNTAVADPASFFTRDARAEDEVRITRPKSRYVLKRPTGRRLSAEFYAEVARAYRDAVAFGLNPRQTIAQDTGAPADTVARWIMKARDAGMLAQTTSGKVTREKALEEEAES